LNCAQPLAILSGIQDAGSNVSPATPHSEEEMSRSEVAQTQHSSFEVHACIFLQLERAFKVLEGAVLDSEGEAASSSQTKAEGF
jgi:hypothetical protein